MSHSDIIIDYRQAKSSFGDEGFNGFMFNNINWLIAN
jgi:hypothetical protein